MKHQLGREVAHESTPLCAAGQRPLWVESGQTITGIGAAAATLRFGF